MTKRTCFNNRIRGNVFCNFPFKKSKISIKNRALIFYFHFRLCREISFQFRTRLPHGLLVYHNVKNPDKIELEPYALYVIVEKGQLKVVHVFGKHSTSVTVGEGLNRDEWHSVMVCSNIIFHCVENEI